MKKLEILTAATNDSNCRVGKTTKIILEENTKNVFKDSIKSIKELNENIPFFTDAERMISSDVEKYISTIKNLGKINFFSIMHALQTL
ncbi:hypothetical protein [Flavobacterium psychrotolerans]|nr:hypothetical protein [Flavobacterium psychrotolerans]